MKYFLTRIITAPRTIFGSVYTRLPRVLKRQSSFAFAVLGGGDALCPQAISEISGRTRLVWAHQLDYDNYLDGPPATAVEKPYAVFLDEYLPYHPDWPFLKLRAPISAEEYYPRLNQLFCEVERQLGGRVIIAAHPRSRYEDLPDVFEGRAVIRGQTAALVRDCTCVITHASTANNFSVLYRKPVVCVSFHQCENQETYFGHVRGLSRALRKPLIFLDEDWSFDLATALQIDPGAYQEYRQRFIKRTGTPEVHFWEIVADAFESWFPVALEGQSLR